MNLHCTTCIRTLRARVTTVLYNMYNVLSICDPTLKKRATTSSLFMIHSVSLVLRTSITYHVIRTRHYVRCTMHCALRTPHHVHFTMPYALCTIYCILRSMHYVPCTTHHGPCTMHYALCTTYHALCIIHHATFHCTLKVFY